MNKPSKGNKMRRVTVPNKEFTAWSDQVINSVSFGKGRAGLLVALDVREKFKAAGKQFDDLARRRQAAIDVLVEDAAPDDVDARKKAEAAVPEPDAVTFDIRPPHWKAIVDFIETRDWTGGATVMLPMMDAWLDADLIDLDEDGPEESGA